MDRKQLRELLDVCRPECADLAQPEMAEVRAELQADVQLRQRANRAEQFDRIVAATMQDVDVPSGARERLLAALAAAAPADRQVEEAATRVERRLDTRRRLPASMVAVLISTAAAVMAMATYRWFVGGDDWAPRSIADAAVHRFTTEFDPRQPRMWSAGATKSGYPLSRHLIQRANPPQRLVNNVAGCAGVAYQLRSPEGAMAALLVLKPRSTLATFPGKPPRNPQVDTAGCAAAAWREDGRLYVLVVAGSAKDYGRFLRGPRLVAAARAPSTELALPALRSH